MRGYDEEPGRGSQLLGSRCLSGRCGPSWRSRLGLPPRLEVTLLDMALGSLASHFARLPQTLGPSPAATYMAPSTHPPAQLKLSVSICSEGGAVLICMCHACSNNSSPLTRLRASNCKFRSHFIDEEAGALKPNNTALPPEGPSTQGGSTQLGYFSPA